MSFDKGRRGGRGKDKRDSFGGGDVGGLSVDRGVGGPANVISGG